MNFLEKIKAIWQNVSLVQRTLLITILLTFVIIAALLIRWASRPDMRLLYQDLNPEEASKITEKISEKNIAYELRNGGTTILVPKEKVYQLRLDMAKDGLPADAQGGYKIFDDAKIGTSPFVQNVNLKRALEDELAKSIQMIEGVAHARIHIVSAKQRLFSSQTGGVTASVALRLSPGHRLNGQNIAAITHLVAGSVEGLKSENVTIIDSQGRLLTSKSDQTMDHGAGTVADYRERVERNLENKVEEMLTTVLGPGRATVKVSAVIDMNSINTVTETYDPTAKVTTKEEIKSGSETEASTAGAQGEPVIPGGVKKDETILTEYMVGKTVKQKADLPGEIKSLSVAAFVDLWPDDANEADDPTAMIMQQSDVEDIIKNALGLKDTASIKVVPIKFRRPDESLLAEEPSGGLNIVAIARNASLGIMALCALLVLKIFSGAKKKTTSALAAGGLPGGAAAGGLIGESADSSEPLVLRKQITSALQSNPDQVKQLFSSWLEEKT